MGRFADLVTKDELTQQETFELRNIADLLENISFDVGSMIGTSGVISKLRAGSVVLDNSGMSAFYQGVRTVKIERDGDVFIGSNVAAAATTSLAIFSNAQTYNSESIGAGDLLIGDNTASKANILWDKSAGTLLFRGGTTTQGWIDTSGSATFGAGGVVLSSLGITIQTAASDPSFLTFADISGETGTYGSIWSQITGSDPNQYGVLYIKSTYQAGGNTGGLITLLADRTDVYTTDLTVDGANKKISMSTQPDAGGAGPRIEVTQTEVNINESGIDADFRVETVNDAYAFVVDAGNEEVVVNENSGTVDFRVETNNADYALFIDGGNDNVVINEDSDDVDFWVETSGVVGALGTDGGLNTAYAALDGSSGTVPQFNIGKLYGQELFEVSKLDWDQTFDEEIADFDAVSPAWDGEVDAVADFDAETDGDGDLNDHADAAHDGAVGLEYTFDDNNAMYGDINADAVNQTSGVFSFWFNANDVDMTGGSVIVLMQAKDGAGNATWRIDYNIDEFRLVWRTDAPGTGVSGWGASLGAGWHHVLLMFTRSTGSDDGTIYLFVDGVLYKSATGIDNDAQDWDYTRWGMISTDSVLFAGSWYMDTIKIDPVGAPFASKLAVKNGTYGLAIPVMDTTGRWTELQDMVSATAMTAECWLDINSLTMATNDNWNGPMQNTGQSGGTGKSIWYMQLNYTGSIYQVRVNARVDAGTWSNGTYVTLSDEYTHIRVEWQAASAAAADDGCILLFMNDVLVDSQTGLDTDTASIDEMLYGVTGTDAGTYGIFYMDDCQWRGKGGIAIDSSGDTYFVGSGSGLPYGSFLGNDLTWDNGGAAQNVWTTVSDASIASGSLNKATYQNNQELKVVKEGMYLANYHLCADSSVANKNMQSALEVNGTEVAEGTTHIYATGTGSFHLAGMALLDLSADDKVSVGVMCSDAAVPTISVTHIGLTIVQVGG